MPNNNQDINYNFLKKLSVMAGFENGFLPNLEQFSEHCFLSQIDELEIIVIKHSKFEAAIALQGAHILNWQPLGQPEIFWLSEKTLFKKNSAIRGGVPICWPWFGKAATPSHGFARTSLWQIKSINDNQNSVNIVLSLLASNQTKKFWPYDFDLELCINLDDSCEITLKSFGDFSFTTALHSYFNLSDIENVKIYGVGPEFIDTLNPPPKIHCQDDLTHLLFSNNNKENMLHSNSIHFKAPVDRIYTQSEETLVLNDTSFKRNILIENHHHISNDSKKSCDTVIWNPGEKISQTMSDMSPDGYLTMGCVETAIISNPIILEKKQSHQLTVKITTELFQNKDV